jgi:hypothetical protein
VLDSSTSFSVFLWAIARAFACARTCACMHVQLCTSGLQFSKLDGSQTRACRLYPPKTTFKWRLGSFWIVQKL